jgi:hypothetical protein
MTSAKQQESGRFASGGVCLGHLVGRGPEGYEAFDVADKSLGIFETQAAAVAALMKGASR